MDDLIWKKQDIALRRAPFLLSLEMKQRAEQMLPLAAGAVMKAEARQEAAPDPG